MREYKNIKVSGYCDYLSKNQSISAKYEKIAMIGEPTLYQKLTSFSCAYSDECQKDIECPIVQTAMQNHKW